MRTQLLATFTTKDDLDKIIQKIKNAYTIAFGKIYVLQNENNVNENTNLFLASREGVIIEQTIANNTLKTELKNLNRLLINEKKSNKIINVSDPVLLKKVEKRF